MSDPNNMALLLTKLMHIGPVTVSLIFTNKYAYGKEAVKWLCAIEHKSKDGTELKVEEAALMPDSAVQMAYEKFFRVAKQGLPAGALSPPVEAKTVPPEQPSKKTLDDEIPF